MNRLLLPVLLLVSASLVLPSCAANRATSSVRELQPYRRAFVVPAAPPAPQVLAPRAAVSAPQPAQRVIQTLSEQERTELMRALIDAPHSYQPPPQTPIVVSPRVRVEREVVEREVCYEHVHSSYCSPGCSLGRIAVYAGVGAIIGHQYHHRGRGAAIGVGLELLGAPWWWGSRCWGR